MIRFGTALALIGISAVLYSCSSRHEAMRTELRQQPPIEDEAAKPTVARRTIEPAARNGSDDLKAAVFVRAGGNTEGSVDLPSATGGIIFRGAVTTPVSLVPSPGELTRTQLFDRVERGLLVTRFHYVNGLVDPRRALQVK